MTSLRPVAFYGLKVPSNGLRIDANPGMPASFQITMAAIDPTEEVTSSGDVPPRAVLKIVRNIFDVVDDESDEDDEDFDEDDVEAIRRRLGITDEDDLDESDSDEDMEDDSDEDMVNGGPSDPEKTRKAKEQSLAKLLKQDEDAKDTESLLTNGVNGVGHKGKGRASDDDLSDDGFSEYVVCTLDPTKNLQQPINIFIDSEEECYFRVLGNYNVHLTGNFVISDQDLVDDSDDNESEDEDEEAAAARLQDMIYGMEEDEDSGEDDDDSEGDLLDDLADPRFTEVESEEEQPPKLVKAAPSKKNKNKRAAEETAEEVVEAPVIEADKRLNKKQKTNAGQAAPAAPAATPKDKKTEKKEKAAKEVKKDDTPQSNGKKVQFAEKLEQGPTPSKPPPANSKRTIGGVNVDDKKLGDGAVAKKGDRVALRYIGKLKDGKVFDSNKKGKPFDFKLGTGQVIKGWDVGVAGMKVGGERRIIVPAKLAYGSKSLPGIPANSDLTFDLKVISIN